MMEGGGGGCASMVGGRRGKDKEGRSRKLSSVGIGIESSINPPLGQYPKGTLR